MTEGSVLSRTLAFLLHSGNITEERAEKKCKNKREKIPEILSPGHDLAISVMISVSVLGSEHNQVCHQSIMD